MWFDPLVVRGAWVYSPSACTSNFTTPSKFPSLTHPHLGACKDRRSFEGRFAFHLKRSVGSSAYSVCVCVPLFGDPFFQHRGLGSSCIHVCRMWGKYSTLVLHIPTSHPSHIHARGHFVRIDSKRHPRSFIHPDTIPGAV